MAIPWSDLDYQKSGATIQTEDYTLTPPNSQSSPKEMEASSSTLSQSPSQSLVRRLTPDCPETWYCFRIQVISTEEGGATPPPPHTWQVPEVEDMLWDGKSGLTESVVMGPGQAILFYGRQSLGEGLSLGETWDAMFSLSGAISWVGKQVQLNANALSLHEGQWLIAQATTKWCVEVSGLGHPHSHLPAFLPFRFCNQDGSPHEARLQSTNKCMEPRCTHWMSHHDQDQASQHSWDHGQMEQDPWAVPTPTPSPSLDSGFETDRSSVSTSLSVSLQSNRCGGSRHMHHCQCHREPGGHMKLNLPVFKDEDKKDAIT